MKKILVTILALVYLTSTIGANVHLHYCMGKLVNSSLVAHKSDRCGKCGMEKSSSKKKSCCRDENRTIKTLDDQQLNIFYSSFEKFVPGAALVQDLAVKIEAVPAVNHEYTSNSPPRTPSVSSYILHCHFSV